MTSADLQCAIARYERELKYLRCTEALLREGLAKAQAMLRKENASAEQTQILSELFAGQQEVANCVVRLTPRQCLILELVLSGYPSKIIATDLGIGQRTPENRRASVKNRSGAKSPEASTRAGFLVFDALTASNRRTAQGGD